MILNRRQFVRLTAAISAGARFGAVGGDGGANARGDAATPTTRNPVDESSVPLRWLGDEPSALIDGVTWGVPWARGTCKAGEQFVLKSRGEAVAVQTWPLATWPDGSLKWTAHAITAGELPGELTLVRGPSPAPKHSVSVRGRDEAIEIDTGVMQCRIGTRGEMLIDSIVRDDQPIGKNLRLTCLRQDAPATASDQTVRRQTFTSSIERATIEQSGPLRAVVRLDGKHIGADGRVWLPFTVRLYFYAGSDALRLMHSFIFDGDAETDFLAGLGITFEVPLRDAMHDRHVRFTGQDDGLWAEAVRGLTGLRRDPGAAVRAAQIAGEATPPIETFPSNVRERMNVIPAWGDFTLSQLSADGFEIRKRTKAGQGWIKASAGQRASGAGYVGGASGGMAFGLRDFWERHPTQLDIRGADTDAAQVTVWLYSPEAPPMDLRFYHDGMGIDSHPEELDAMEITYEDYEKGFGTATGIARTSELKLQALARTPTRQATADFADQLTSPPMLACTPQRFADVGVVGGLFSVPDRSTPPKARIEEQLNFYIDYYQKQIEQHRWYGFWDYGDVMHTYDTDRHAWRYDVGGYAWANSELSPDLWLWYSFLRSGRADVFRMAEAMTRHTGEVDVYHTGRFAGLGTRHNVQHWGCSAKQLRISTAVYRRFYYYLTADERVGDLIRELVDADQTFLRLDPLRKIRTEPYAPDPHALSISFGTDWGSLAGAWLTEYERSGDAKWRDKLLAGMKSIGALPHGFFTKGALFDPATGAFTAPADAGVEVSHLSAVFGLVEIVAELIDCFDVPEFKRAWLQYCTLYSASREEQERALGTSLRGNALTSAHSRLTAYAAATLKDASLAQRAWKEFFSQDQHGGINEDDAATARNRTRRIEGPDVLHPIDEAPGVSTNDTAQWSLAAIQNLALIGDHLPAAAKGAQ